MKLNEYQIKAMSTCTNSSANWSYMAGNLTAEVGELHGAVAKLIRKDKAVIENNQLMFTDKCTDEDKQIVMDELGDALWQLSGVATILKLSLNDVAESNLTKLADRQERGVIVGSGDKR